MRKRVGKTVSISSLLAGLALVATSVALHRAYKCGVGCSATDTMHIQALAETAKLLGIAAIISTCANIWASKK